MKLFIHSKLKRLHHWSLGMDKWFDPTLYNERNYLSVLVLKQIHFSKRDPRWSRVNFIHLFLFFSFFFFFFRGGGGPSVPIGAIAWWLNPEWCGGNKFLTDQSKTRQRDKGWSWCIILQIYCVTYKYMYVYVCICMCIYVYCFQVFFFSVI